MILHFDMDKSIIEKPVKRKYVKLTGSEIITQEAQKHAMDFSQWFSENITRLKSMIYQHCCDEDILHDTYIHIYECIAYKGIVIKDFQWYFLRSYYRKLIYNKKKAPLKIDIDDNSYAEVRCLSLNYFDQEEREQAIEIIDQEIMIYVRNHYNPLSYSIFEMYVKLLPNISYKKLAQMIDYPFNKIWPVMSEIRKDLAQTFKTQKEFLLSID